MTSVMLTGATGYLGRNLVSSFLKRGCVVYALVRSSSDIKNLKELNKRLKFVWFDYPCNIPFKGFPIPDIIVHSATDYGLGDRSVESVLLTNLMLPVHLMEYVKQNKNSRFYNIDSFFSPFFQTHSYLKSYSQSKSHFYDWGKLIASESEIFFSNLRLFHLYGPGDNRTRFLTQICNDCIKGNSIYLSPGEQVRDFIYLDDAVRLITEIVLDKKLANNSSLDIGSGIGTKISDLVKLINKICGDKSKLHVGARPYRDGEIMKSIADATSLEKVGLSVSIVLEVGLKRIVDSLSRP